MRKIGLGFFLLVFLMSCGNKKTKMDPFATITNLVKIEILAFNVRF